MGITASAKFLDSFDPSSPIPKGVTCAEYRVHAPVMLETSLTPGHAARWNMWHAVVRASCPYLARSDMVSRGDPSGAVPVTIFQLNPEGSYPGGDAGRVHVFASVAAVLKSIQQSTTLESQQPSALTTNDVGAFPMLLQHLEVGPDPAAECTLLALVIGQYAPICRYAGVKVHPGTPPVRNPIDVYGTLPSDAVWHDTVVFDRPLRKRPIPLPTSMTCTEVLFGLCDLANALTALHEVHLVQHRSLHWDAVYCRNDSPHGRMRWVPWEPTFALTQSDIHRAAPGIQKLIVDACLSRTTAADLALCAPEDRDPGVSDDTRRSLPLSATDAYAFGGMILQCMPPDVVSATAQPNANISPSVNSSARSAAESLAVFAHALQSPDPHARPKPGDILRLPVVQRSTFVQVMRTISYWYPDEPNGSVSVAVDAARMPTAKLLLSGVYPHHEERAAWLGALHIELQRIPYELMMRRVLPLLVQPVVMNDPCAGPLFGQIFMACNVLTAPKPHGSAIGIGASSAPGSQRPNRFLRHGLMLDEHHAPWLTEILKSHILGFGQPGSLTRCPETYRLLVLLRNAESYLFSVDVTTICDHIVPGVVELLCHPAADVAAEALICFGKLCRVIFAAVEGGKDVGNAKDQLIAAYDSQIYRLACGEGIRRGAIHVRCAALRIAARSLEKHKLMSRDKVCTALHKAMSHYVDEPDSSHNISVVQLALDLLEHLAKAESSRRSRGVLTSGAVPPSNEGNALAEGATDALRSASTPTSKATATTIGVFYPSEVARFILPGLVALGTAFAGVAEQDKQECGATAARLFKEMCSDLAALDGTAADGASFVSNAAIVATSREWDGAGLLYQEAPRGRNTSSEPSVVPAALEPLHTHTLLVPVPVMPVDADGIARQIPKPADLPPAGSDIYRPISVTADGHAIVIEIPTVVPYTDNEAEWCANSFLVLPPAQGAAGLAGLPNLRSHPVAPYLSTRLSKTTGLSNSSSQGLTERNAAAQPSSHAKSGSRAAKREARAAAIAAAARIAAEEAAEEQQRGQSSEHPVPLAMSQQTASPTNSSFAESRPHIETIAPSVVPSPLPTSPAGDPAAATPSVPNTASGKGTRVPRRRTAPVDLPPVTAAPATSAPRVSPFSQAKDDDDDL